MMLNKFKWAVFVAAGFLACSSLLADVADVWRSSEKPASLAGGKVTFTYVDGANTISGITATPTDGETISLSGDEMNFAANATIDIAAEGELKLTNALNCAGHLYVNGSGDSTVKWHDGLASNLYDATQALLPTNRFETMFTNMNLDDWEPVAFEGKELKNRPNPDPEKSLYTSWAFPNNFNAHYFQRRTVDGVKQMEVQLVYSSSESRKSIRILLQQNGSDVEGKVLEAYTGGNTNVATQTIEESLLDPDSTIETYGVACPGTKSGYGVSELTMRRIRPGARLYLDNEVTIPSSKRIVVATNACVLGRVGANTASDSGGGFKLGVDTQGTFTFDSPGKDRAGFVKGTLNGVGVLTYEGTDTMSDTPFENYYKNALPTTKGVWEADLRFIFDLTNASIKVVDPKLIVSGTSMDARTANLYWLKDTTKAGDADPSALAQFQVTFGNDIVCAYVRYYQGGGGTSLYAQLMKAFTAPKKTYPRGTDFDTIPEKDKTEVAVDPNGSSATDGLGAYQMRTYFSVPSGRYVTMTAPGTNTQASVNSRFRISGSDVRSSVFRANCTGALPIKGKVEIENGGYLQMLVAGVNQKGYNGGAAEFLVRKGGYLCTYKQDPFNDAAKIFLDGGTLRVGAALSATDSGPYLHNLVMKDGARVIGKRLRAGNRTATPTYVVCGTEPSQCDANIQMQGRSADTDYSPLQLRVADVTGDDEPDFVLNGCIEDYPEHNCPFRKLGPGTVLMNGEHHLKASVSLEDGAWKLGKSGLTNVSGQNTTGFVLAGGSLVAAAGTENTIETLSNGASGGTLKLEAGAKLTINELSLDAAKGKVVIDGDLSQKVLRVGTSAASLASVAKLRVLTDGRERRVLVDEDGWVGGLPGAIFIIR